MLTLPGMECLFSHCYARLFLFFSGREKQCVQSWYPETKQHASLPIKITYLPQSIWHHHHYCCNRHHCCCTYHHYQWRQLDDVLATKTGQRQSLIWVTSRACERSGAMLSSIFCFVGVCSAQSLTAKANAPLMFHSRKPNPAQTLFFSPCL